MTKPQTKFKVPTQGIPLKDFQEMTIGQIRKLDRDYKRLIEGGKRQI